jgi:hypothetical protein
VGGEGVRGDPRMVGDGMRGVVLFDRRVILQVIFLSLLCLSKNEVTFKIIT